MAETKVANRYVEVSINRTERRDRYEGYEAGDPLKTAVVFQVPPFDHFTDEQVLDKVFRLFNGPPEAWGTLTVENVITYHNRFPSLSIGDVVSVGGNHYACARFGWTKIEDPDAADIAR